MSDVVTGAVAFALGVLLGRVWRRRRLRAARVEAAWLRGLLALRAEPDWRDARPPTIRIDRKE